MKEALPSELYEVRSPRPDDRNFLFASWLRGLYYGNDWFQDIPSEIFYRHYQKIIERIFERPNLDVRVACLREDPDVILGFSVSELLPKENAYALHWIFVKESWRRMGIGKTLLHENTTATTHITRLGKMLKPKSMQFNPFLF